MIWAAHFLLCYATASIWCAKVVGLGGSLASARVAIAVYTALALVGIGIVGRIGHRRYSHGNATLPHDDDTPEDRHRFLGFAALLLSALSAVAVIYAGPGHLLLQKLLLMRRLLLLLGLLTLAAVWLGPLADAARRAFSAHMLMHMGVVAVAAPLLACARRTLQRHHGTDCGGP